MRNKVLVVDASRDEQQWLEQVLQGVVEEGGEIFFAEKREEGLVIMRKEHPQLIFLDHKLVGVNEDEWVLEGTHVILMRERNEPYQKSEDFILKPLKAHQVLEKCHAVLKKEAVPPTPPM